MMSLLSLLPLSLFVVVVVAVMLTTHGVTATNAGTTHSNLRSSTTSTSTSSSTSTPTAPGATAAARELLTPNFDPSKDLLAEFKNRNLLKDDFDKIPLQIQQGGSNGNAAVSFGGGGTTTTSTTTSSTSVTSFNLNNLQPLPTVFTSNAQYYMDGKLQTKLPTNTLYTSDDNDDSDVVIMMNPDNDSQLQGALSTNPTTGKTTILMPMDLDLQVFTEVETTDIDPEKLSRYHFSEERPSRSLQQLLLQQEQEQEDRLLRQQQQQQQQREQPCESFQILQVAIAYESRFCETMGGASRANQVVQLTIQQASQKFQRSNLCTKLQLSHLEGYCSPASDPYKTLFSGSVCKHNDAKSILKLFRNYWVANRQHVARDVAHLFHGFNHASGTVGCAWAGSLCDDWFGYGVNELTFGGNNNPTFWTILFAHELGHSSGAPHASIDSKSLMNPQMCMECDEFSDNSVAYMKLHMNSVDCLTEEGGSPGTGGDLTPPSTNNGNNNDNSDNTIVDTDNNNGWGGTCSNRLGYCNLGPCCQPYQCYNRFICL